MVIASARPAPLRVVTAISADTGQPPLTVPTRLVIALDGCAVCQRGVRVELNVGAAGLDRQIGGGAVVVILYLDRLQPGGDVLPIPLQDDLLLVRAGASDDLEASNILRLLDRGDLAVGLDVEAENIPAIGGEIEFLLALLR